jgi:hypothetical protein
MQDPGLDARDSIVTRTTDVTFENSQVHRERRPPFRRSLCHFLRLFWQPAVKLAEDRSKLLPVQVEELAEVSRLRVAHERKTYRLPHPAPEVREEVIEPTYSVGMAEQRPAILRAVDDLVAALDEIREVGGIPLGGGLADLWPSLARSMLARWGADLRRTAGRTLDALAAARAAPVTDDGVDAVERATWRIAGARDKLRAIVSLALGMHAIRLDRAGVRFAPNHRKIARRLDEIGTPDALRLRKLFDQIAEHPAIALRNQISRSLSPVAEVAELCWIDVGILDEKNRIVAWDTSTALYPEDVLDQASLAPETIYDFAVDAVEQALALVTDAVAATTAVIREEGKLYAPFRVYRDKQGTIHIERPA